ncbi:MAG: cytidine deaminase [Betaproteobacteria bacterium]|nr:cytidine deaminase [Betaproteobacteria bacterium]MDE2004540.1 cytidine deaminase [Betaproteobacteria bacterium]MDE2358417.1 cytidine deaminase [Betaproteobacteria bacterium]
MPDISDPQWLQLADAARRASANAHCPYSRFRVGAAVLTGDGGIAAGCNVENASYGLTVCAERSAVTRAVADGARSIEAVVVYTPTAEPVTPCGACRQVIAEFGRDARIRCICDGPGVLEFCAADLLPSAFPKSGSEL